jgi:hypothetical protein
VEEGAEGLIEREFPPGLMAKVAVSDKQIEGPYLSENQKSEGGLPMFEVPAHRYEIFETFCRCNQFFAGEAGEA